MNHWFLQRRPWQLFGLLFGVPVLLQLGLLVALLLPAALSGSQPPIASAVVVIIGYLVAVGLGLGGLIGWFRAIGLGLQPLLPATQQPATKWVRVAAWIPLVYLGLLVVLAAGATGARLSPPGSSALLVLPLILVPHLLAMASIFYCLYFAARTLRTAELGRPAGVADFLGEFFLLWFFPVGVWVVQPRLNALAARLPAA